MAIVIAIGVVVFFIIFKPQSKFSTTLELINPQNQVDSLPADIPENLVAAPTPFLLLPTGKQEYLVQSSADTKIGLSRIVMDPLNIEKDDTQQITVETRSDSIIDSISAEFESDNGKTLIPLAFYSGDTKNGFWVGKWKVTDTTDKIYHLVFIIKSAGQEYKTDFPVR